MLHPENKVDGVHKSHILESRKSHYPQITAMQSYFLFKGIFIAIKALTDFHRISFTS